jgi:hypothetical protein
MAELVVCLLSSPKDCARTPENLASFFGTHLYLLYLFSGHWIVARFLRMQKKFISFHSFLLSDDRMWERVDLISFSNSKLSNKNFA